jgi:hypothetical protein
VAVLCLLLALLCFPGDHRFDAAGQDSRTLAGAPARRADDRPANPGFFVDDQGRMLVVDHLRGFIVGRFQPPTGLSQGQPSPGGGVGLETPMRMGPDLPATPLTTLRMREGFPVVVGSAIAGSPCVADLDGNGTREIIAATVAGQLHWIGADGAGAPGWPVDLAAGCYAPPSVGDLDGDGRAEVVVGDIEGRLHAWRLDGTPAPGWPVTLPAGADTSSAPAPLFGAAALGDLDGDGRDEVAVATAGGLVWTLTGRGETRPGWPQATHDRTDARLLPGSLASPAIADLDGDGAPEIIAATNGGEVFAWHAGGARLPGWPAGIPHDARAGFGDPAVGDVDGDGRAEVVVTSEQGMDGSAAVAVFSAAGRPLPGWPFILPETCNAGAALADFDGDGAAEIVAATIGGDASLFVLDGRTAAPLPGWPVHFSHQTINASPLVADLDGDGELDILVPPLSTDLETHTWLWAGSRTGRELRTFPVFLPHDEIVRAAPVVADLDGDGGLELISVTEVISSVHVWDLAVLDEPGATPWPALSAGPSRQGYWQAPDGAPLRERWLANRPAEASPTAETPGTPPATPPAGAAPGGLATVVFDLEETTEVCLAIFDIQGTPVRKLLDHFLPAGHYEILWDGRDDEGHPRTSGIYFYQISLGDRATTRQLLLLK